MQNGRKEMVGVRRWLGLRRWVQCVGCGSGGVLMAMRRSWLVRMSLWAGVVGFVAGGMRLWALTSGPSQPEFMGFQAVSVKEHVDPFTGDFSYTIELGSVDGVLPITLSYSSSAVTPETEASWVGLGWNLNLGGLQRSVNNVPDDAKGDPFTVQRNIKENWSFAVTAYLDPEMIGVELPEDLKEVLGIMMGLTVGYEAYGGFFVGTEREVKLLPQKLDFGRWGVVGKVTGGVSASYQGGKGYSVSMSANVALRHKSGIALSMQPMMTYSPAGFQANMGLQTAYKNYVGFSGVLYPTVQFHPYAMSSVANYSFGIGFRPGLTIFGFHIKPGLSIHFSKQWLLDKVRVRPMYGYLHWSGRIDDPWAVYDAVRERPEEYVKGKPVLSPAMVTPDRFSASAPGLSLTFVPERNGWVVFGPSMAVMLNASDQIDPTEGAGGNMTHGGLDFVRTVTVGELGPWQEAVDALGGARLGSVVWRAAGGATILNADAWDALGGEEPVAFPLDIGWNFGRNPRKVMLGEDVSLPDARPYQYLEEQSYAITHLTIDEAEKLWRGVFRSRKPYMKDHHLGGFIVITPGGLRYEFTQPLYVIEDVEVKMREDDREWPGEFFVEYDDDNRYDGIDNLYERTERPAYPYLWPLKFVYSADYSDRTGDGPTRDDFGWWAKFTYDFEEEGRDPRTHQWRDPVGDHLARLFKGSDVLGTKDNLASYVYGKKEIAYLRKIESPYTLVEFHLSERDDGIGVNEDGTLALSDRQFKLDSISFYTINENYRHLTRRVYFTYDYSLAKGTPNSVVPDSQGRLTLRSVRIVDLHLGERSISGTEEYHFTYWDEDAPYEAGKMDRWGVYKLDASMVMPYAEDDPAVRNAHVRRWLLKSIRQPTGLTIEVEYESDRYRYVQDRRAMKFYKVVGISSSSSAIGNLTNPLSDDNVYLWVALDASSSEEAHQQAQSLMEDVQYLYLKGRIRTTPEGYDGPVKADWIETFAKRVRWGVHEDGGRWYLWIEVEPVNLDGISMHPLTAAAIQYSIARYPKIVYPNFPSVDLSDLKGTAINFISWLLNAILYNPRGPIGSLYDQGVGREIMEDDDGNRDLYVRLNDLDERLGGGARVVRVVYRDTTDGVVTTHELEYHYEEGVAANEPSLGYEECALAQPLFYHRDWGRFPYLFPVRGFYLVGPVGRSLYPPPSIGYRKVEVRHKTPDGVLGTGKTVYEYLTYYDHPVRTEYTIIGPNNTFKRDVKTARFWELLGVSWDVIGVSQGFSVITHNLHGRVKRISKYGAPVSSESPPPLIEQVTYHYRRGAVGIPMVDRDGEIRQYRSGVELEFVVDASRSYLEVHSVRINPNVNSFIAFIVPVVVPMIWGLLQPHYQLTCVITTTKRIHYHYFIDRVETKHLGAEKVAYTLAYDRLTGSPLLSKVVQGWDSVWQVQYPAWWFVKGMEAASGRLGMRAFLRTDGEGRVVGAPVRDGDLWVSLSDGEHYWVLEDRQHPGAYYLIDRDGQPVRSRTIYAFLYVPGTKNMVNATVGSVVTMDDPVVDVGGGRRVLWVRDDARVLTASLNRYEQHWQMYCPECDTSKAGLWDTLVFPLAWTYGEVGPFSQRLIRVADRGMHVACLRQHILSRQDEDDGQGAEYGIEGGSWVSSSVRYDVGWLDRMDAGRIVWRSLPAGVEWRDLALSRRWLVTAGLHTNQKRAVIAVLPGGASVSSSGSIQQPVVRVSGQAGWEPLDIQVRATDEEDVFVGVILWRRLRVASSGGGNAPGRTRSGLFGPDRYRQRREAALGFGGDEDGLLSSEEASVLAAIDEEEGRVLGCEYALSVVQLRVVPPADVSPLGGDGGGSFRGWRVVFRSAGEFVFSDRCFRGLRLVGVRRALSDLFVGIQGFGSGEQTFFAVKMDTAGRVFWLDRLDSLRVQDIALVGDTAYVVGVDGAPYLLVRRPGSRLWERVQLAMSGGWCREEGGSDRSGIWRFVRVEGRWWVAHVLSSSSSDRVVLVPVVGALSLGNAVVYRVQSLRNVRSLVYGESDDGWMVLGIVGVDGWSLWSPAVHDEQCSSCPLEGCVVKMERTRGVRARRVDVVQEDVVRGVHVRRRRASVSTVSKEVYCRCSGMLRVAVRYPTGCCDGEVRILNADDYEHIALLGQNVNGVDTMWLGEHVRHLCPGLYRVIVRRGEQGGGTCYALAEIALDAHIACFAPNGVVNPFVEGLEGRWYVKQPYTLLRPRVPEDVSTAVRIREHGYVKDYPSFVYWDGSRLRLRYDGWVPTATQTKVQPWGEPTESRDALGVYSMAMFGYGKHLPVLVVMAARYQEAMFTSFEDVTSFLTHIVIPPSQFWQLWHDRVHAPHTGIWSYYLKDTFTIGGRWNQIHCSGAHTHSVPYRVTTCDCLGRFSPDIDEPLFYWVWVKRAPAHPVYGGEVRSVRGGLPLPAVVSEEPVPLRLEVRVPRAPLAHTQNILGTETGPSPWQTTVYEPEYISPEIEGWRLYRFRFVLPATCGSFFITLKTTEPVYIDDIRIEPFHGIARAFVYDPVTLDVVARFGPSHFSEQYRYDERGQLSHILVETERGKVGGAHQRSELRESP